MEWKRGLIAGIAAGITIVVVDIIIWAATGNYLMPYYEASAQVWKPMEPLMNWLLQMWVAQIVFGIIYGLAYSLLYDAIPGKGVRKGLNYGLLIWLIATIPGMIMTYVFMAVPTIIVISWVLGGLVDLPLMGVMLAVVYERVK